MEDVADMAFKRLKGRTTRIDIRPNANRRRSAASICTGICVAVMLIGTGATFGAATKSVEQDSLTKTELDSGENQFHRIMQLANSALMKRDATLALSLYEQAATQFGERPQAELGQIHARLLSGSFREALAFANLVVGEHADFPPAVALLAFLEDRSGHKEIGIARLEAALKRWPESVSLRAALAEILIDHGSVSKAISLLDDGIEHHSDNADLLRLRARAATLAGNPRVAAHWRGRGADAYKETAERTRLQQLPDGVTVRGADSIYSDLTHSIQKFDNWPPPIFEHWPTEDLNPINVGNGIVIDAGRRVLTVASLATRIGEGAFVRNGTGQVRKGIVESRDDVTGLAVLLVDPPYDSKSSIESVGFKAATAGGFCFTLGFPVVGDIDGNYPVLSQGIVVRTRMGSATLTQFTAWVSPEQRGAPLFDSAGNLIGIYRGTGDQIETAKRDGLGNGNFAVGIESVTAHSKVLEAPQKPLVSTPIFRSPDELYEKLLPLVVSIVVTP